MSIRTPFGRFVESTSLDLISNEDFTGVLKFDNNYDFGQNIINENIELTIDLTDAKTSKWTIIRAVGDGTHNLTFNSDFYNQNEDVFDNTNLMENTILACYEGATVLVSIIKQKLIPDPNPMTLSSLSFSSISQIAATFNLTGDKEGVIKWGVLLATASTPSKAEILAGTGTLSYGSKSTNGNVAETVSITGLAYSTNYKLYYYTINKDDVEGDVIATDQFSTIARTKMTAPVITVSSGGVDQLDISVNANVNGVELYMSSTENGTYTAYETLVAGDTTANSLTGLVQGTTRYFKGIAKGNNTTTIDSDLSIAYSGTTEEVAAFNIPTYSLVGITKADTAYTATGSGFNCYAMSSETLASDFVYYCDKLAVGGGLCLDFDGVNSKYSSNPYGFWQSDASHVQSVTNGVLAGSYLISAYNYIGLKRVGSTLTIVGSTDKETWATLHTFTGSITNTFNMYMSLYNAFVLNNPEYKL